MLHANRATTVASKTSSFSSGDRVMGGIPFTPVEQRMLAVLSDGMSHTREELRLCLRDELAEMKMIRTPICNLRKKLRSRGQTIICELNGWRHTYRHVQLLAPASRE